MEVCLLLNGYFGVLWFNGYFGLVRYSELSSMVEAGLDLWYQETSDLSLDNQPSVWFVCQHSFNLVYNKSDLDPLVVLQNSQKLAFATSTFFSNSTIDLSFKKISAYVGNSVFLQISIWTNYKLQFETGWCAWFLQSKMSQAYPYPSGVWIINPTPLTST